MRGERVLRSFDVALGLSPTGPKPREGDFRTPEGNYRLAGRNPNSDFFLAIQVDYPRPEMTCAAPPPRAWRRAA